MMRFAPTILTSCIGASLALATTLDAQTPPAPGEPGGQAPAAAPTPTPTPGAEASPDDADAKAQEDEIKRNERLKRLEESRKLLATEQSARALAELGPLGTYQGATGTVTVDTSNNAVMEATILATRSLDEIGYVMGDRLADVVRDANAAAPPQSAPLPIPGNRAGLCAEVRANDRILSTPTAKPVIIVAATGATLTDQADSFMLRSAALGRELCAALEQADAVAVAGPPPAVKPGQPLAEKPGGSIPAVAAAVDTIARLFRADYKIYGIIVAEDEKLLSRSVALRFLNAKPRLPNPVLLPELFPPNAGDRTNPAVRRLTVLDGLRLEAVGRLMTTKDQRLTEAVTAYDKVLAALTTIDGGQPPLIGTVLRQAKLRQMLDGGAYLVVTDIQRMGGTSYDKKNFFTFIGGMPYFVSGSAAASYTVQDTNSEAVLDALNLQISGGYHRVNNLPRSFRPASDRR